MKQRSDFIGTELDWFAVDADGFVALLSSAGFGPIPDCVFERFEEQRRIEEFLARLAGQGLMADWKRMILALVATGVFVYDWQHWGGPYCRQGAPSVPRRWDELGIPDELRPSFAILPQCFAASRTLRPELALPCTW